MNKFQHSNHFPDSFHRVSVKALCVKDDKIFPMKEPEELSGQWELPGGGLDFGESPKEGNERWKKRWVLKLCQFQINLCIHGRHCLKDGEIWIGIIR